MKHVNREGNVLADGLTHLGRERGPLCHSAPRTSGRPLALCAHFDGGKDAGAVCSAWVLHAAYGRGRTGKLLWQRVAHAAVALDREATTTPAEYEAAEQAAAAVLAYLQDSEVAFDDHCRVVVTSGAKGPRLGGARLAERV